jgi:demethylmenaquinone methyltransferase/2-methoxy-6-polyprenyl-1,4-benzoquinol methylase
MTDEIQAIIQQQIAYYRSRAGEYDEWFLRQGRYDHGEALNRAWFQEVEQVRRALERFGPEGSVLELACGTGLWTQQLLLHAGRITALDASAEVIALNQQRLRELKQGSLAYGSPSPDTNGSSSLSNSPWVRYIQADLFTWQPEETYDVVFFSFWLSHVPTRLFEPFWSMVKSCLKPGGRVFFIDSKYEPTSTARDHTLPAMQAETSKRRLNDGSEFEIVKIFYDPGRLEERLQRMGWDARVAETPSYFLYGFGSPA